MGIIVHSSVYPNWAPAWEYVRIPPESLSTLAVMNPGPRTAKNSSIRFRQRFHMPSSRSYGGFILCCLHDHNRRWLDLGVTNASLPHSTRPNIDLSFRATAGSRGTCSCLKGSAHETVST